MRYMATTVIRLLALQQMVEWVVSLARLGSLEGGQQHETVTMLDEFERWTGMSPGYANSMQLAH